MWFFLLGGMGQAQQIDSLSLQKMDAGMKLFLRQSGFSDSDKEIRTRTSSSGDEDPLFPVLIRCTDSEALVAVLREGGIESRVILPSLVTARIPANEVNRVALLPQVTKLIASRKASLSLANSRKLTGMDRIQSGEGLESPYTGKGVVIGIIDQGFEYVHPAFSTPQGELRIKRVWNRALGQEPLLTAQEIRAARNDGTDEAHATHVTGIAAGSRVEGSNFHGNAPDAELVIVSSEFETSEILEDVKFIHDYADAQGKPCVINMSFGQQIGPHDGSTDSDQAIDRMVGKGKIVVAAMGNSGDVPMHLQYFFSTGQDTLRSLLMPEDDEIKMYLLGADRRSFTVDFFLYDPHTAKMILLEKTDCDKYIKGETEVNDRNGKFYGLFVWDYAAMKEGMHIPDSYLPGIRVFDTPANSIFHAWVEDSQARFSDGDRTDGYFTPGDSQYTVGEIGSSPSRTLAIGAYNSCTNWTTWNGKEAGYAGYGKVGEVTNFSCFGPQLDNSLPKPLICAPGVHIASAYSKQERDFNPQENTNIVLKVSGNGEDFYYGMEAGTSMASPQVAGIIACWMQAYPQLTPEQAMEIIRKTALNDAYTGEIRETWHNQWGYGKIDAYAGLKECIKLAAASGMNEVRDSETPVSLYKSRECWKLFFNSEETEATLTLYALGGSPVMERTLSNIPCGHEEVLELDSYTPGCYLLMVQTAKIRLVRKVIVR